MTRYTALIDGEDGAYGVAFPDLPGCVAMGDTVDAALRNASEVLREWVIEMEAQRQPIALARNHDALLKDSEVREALAEGAVLASVALVREARAVTKANMSLDVGILAAIDAEAERMGVNRSRMVEIMAKRTLAEMG